MRIPITSATVSAGTYDFQIPDHVNRVSVVLDPASGFVTGYASLGRQSTDDAASSWVPWSLGTVTEQSSAIYDSPISQFRVVCSGNCKVNILGAT